jgi:hypothetical protein
VTDTVTAPAPEKPATPIALRQLVDTLLEQAEADETTLGQVVELTAIKRELDVAIKTVKDKIAPRHDELLDAFGQEGVTSKRHAESGKLIYVNRRIWARPAGEDKADACQALKAAGLGEFVREGFNTTSLSAYFNEQVKNAEADGQPVTDLEQLLPQELRGAIALTEDHKIGVRS